MAQSLHTNSKRIQITIKIGNVATSMNTDIWSHHFRLWERKCVRLRGETKSLVKHSINLTHFLSHKRKWWDQISVLIGVATNFNCDLYSLGSLYANFVPILLVSYLVQYIINMQIMLSTSQYIFSLSNI